MTGWGYHSVKVAIVSLIQLDEKGEVSKQFDDLEMGNIFEGKSLDDGISPYLNKNFSL